MIRTPIKSLISSIGLAVLFAFVFQSCQPPEKEEKKDLAYYKKELAEKKKELNKLKTAVKGLQDTIAILDPSSVEKKRRLVTIDTVNTKDFQTFIEVQGSVVSDETANASSEMGGRIVQLLVDEGSYVTNGQLVATTDMESVNKSIAEVQKSLELANEVFIRQSNLWKQNIGTEIQFLQAKNNKEQLEKRLESIRFNLTKANVYAPMTGVVDMVYVKQGEMAGPGGPILKIMSTSVVKIVADVSESYLKSVKRGNRVKIEFPALERTRYGRIATIGRSINAGNRTFQIEINLSNKGGWLKPNLMALVFLNDFSAKRAVVLPTELVQQDISGKDFVYLKAEHPEDGLIAKKVFIETDQTFDGETLIVNGLEGGEMMIVQGARDVNDEEPIKVLRIDDAPVVEEEIKKG